MPTVRTDDGVAIAYQTRGPGPRHLLFLHGWAGDGTYWDEMLQHLDLTGLRLLLADLRGHGASDHPLTGFTLERFARDMFAVADDAGAPQVVLVGFSMSGRFAQFMTCLEPERVLGQILIGPAPATAYSLPPEVHREWVGLSGNRDAFRKGLQGYVREPLRPDVIDRFLDAAVKVPALALDETLKMCASPSFAARLAAAPTPSLVLGGLHDPLMPPEFLRQHVVALIPNARLVLLDCGHEMPLEKSRETAALIEAFLAGLG